MDAKERYRQIAELHAANLDRGFLATLGVDFLSLMYQSMDEADQCILITEEQGDRVVGFISGGLGMSPIYRRMLRHPVRLALATLPSVLRPSRLRRILEILRYGRGAGAASAWPAAELMSVAVRPDFRGTGVAERLYTRLKREFLARGVAEFRIIVGAELDRAHRYYIKMGATPIDRTEVHRGELSVVYVQHV